LYGLSQRETRTEKKVKCMNKRESKKIKPIPVFENEDQEREFWAGHSAVDYFDMKKITRVWGGFPNLKRSASKVRERMVKAG